MEISGRVFKVMPIISGESAKGKWQKQEVVVEIESGKFPKKVCVTVWGDLAGEDKYTEGENISFEIDIESREYNGRWYTDVKAWRVNNSVTANSAAPSNYATTPSSPAPIAPELSINSLEPTDDLPF